METQNYVGLFVFVERAEGYREYSAFNGEYFVIKQSERNLYAIQSGACEYASSVLHVLPLAGPSRFTVLSVRRDDCFALEMLRGMDAFIDSGDDLPSPSHVKDVYCRAKSHRHLVAEAIDSLPDEPDAKSQDAGENEFGSIHETLRNLIGSSSGKELVMGVYRVINLRPDEKVLIRGPECWDSKTEAA